MLLLDSTFSNNFKLEMKLRLIRNKRGYIGTLKTIGLGRLDEIEGNLECKSSWENSETSPNRPCGSVEQ